MNNNIKNIMLVFMSGDQTWKRRIRLRTQATYTLENTGHLVESENSPSLDTVTIIASYALHVPK